MDCMKLRELIIAPVYLVRGRHTLAMWCTRHGRPMQAGQSGDWSRRHGRTPVRLPRPWKYLRNAPAALPWSPVVSSAQKAISSIFLLLVGAGAQLDEYLAHHNLGGATTNIASPVHAIRQRSSGARRHA